MCCPFTQSRHAPKCTRLPVLSPPCRSVLFFTSLLLLGIGLPKWVKFWKHPRVTGLFKRNKATKLEAPAAEQTPAAAAVDAKDTSSVVEPVAAAAS